MLRHATLLAALVKELTLLNNSVKSPHHLCTYRFQGKLQRPITLLSKEEKLEKRMNIKKKITYKIYKGAITAEYASIEIKKIQGDLHDARKSPQSELIFF